MSVPDDEKPGPTNKLIKAVKGVAAVIAFIIAVAGAIQYFKAPSVKLTTSGPLLLSYKPIDNLVEISFDVTFDNSGYGSEVIRSTNARLIHSTLPSGENYIPFTINDLVFLEKKADAEPAPMTIDKESTKKVTCILRHTPGGVSTKVIETLGKLHLYINLFGKKRYLDMFGEDKEYKLEFCFESDGSTLKSIGKVPKKLNSISCS